MGYKIEFTRRAVRDFESLPAVERRNLGRKIDALGANPRPDGVRKLRGAEGLYRIRTGDYRVIHSIADKKLLVLVILVGNRKDIYD